jgi:hypothetical protein
MAHDPEGSWSISEGMSHFSRRAALNKERPKGFVLALLWGTDFNKETTAIRYVFWCADRHILTLPHEIPEGQAKMVNFFRIAYSCPFEGFWGKVSNGTFGKQASRTTLPERTFG